jgi:antitoxin component of MazEF toxin-antitoxin module
MTMQRLRRSGDSYVIEIAAEEVERLQITEGQLLGIEITPIIDGRPVLRPELAEALEESWKRNEAAYRYLESR